MKKALIASSIAVMMMASSIISVSAANVTVGDYLTSMAKAMEYSDLANEINGRYGVDGEVDVENLAEAIMTNPDSVISLDEFSDMITEMAIQQSTLDDVDPIDLTEDVEAHSETLGTSSKSYSKTVTGTAGTHSPKFTHKCTLYWDNVSLTFIKATSISCKVNNTDSSYTVSSTSAAISSDKKYITPKTIGKLILCTGNGSEYYRSNSYGVSVKYAL